MRTQFNDFRHWATRHKTEPNPSLRTKKLQVIADSLSDAASISLCLNLLEGKAPAPIQSKFDADVTKTVKTYMKENPDYEFSLGGPPISADSKTTATPIPKIKSKSKASPKTTKSPKKAKPRTRKPKIKEPEMLEV